MKELYYDANVLMARIKRHYPLILTSSKFQAATEKIIDCTMACDKTEQLAWLNHFMAKAVEMDTAAKTVVDRNGRDELHEAAAALFAAAYSLI